MENKERIEPIEELKDEVLEEISGGGISGIEFDYDSVTEAVGSIMDE